MNRSNRLLLHRITIATTVLAVLALVAWISWGFIPVFIFAVFLYYSVRPIYTQLERVNIPPGIRAGTALSLFGLPFVCIIVYTAFIVIGEAHALAQMIDSQQSLVESLSVNENFEITQTDLRELVAEIQAETGVENGLVSVAEVISQLSSWFINLLVMLVLTYTMLVDGPRFKSWVVEILDRDGVIEQYAQDVDKELSSALFGNIVNVFVTAAIAVVIFTGYNLVAPQGLSIPFPGLLGALAGIGSLIPVVGIKLVYVPLTAWLVSNSFALQNGNGLTAITVMFLLSVVVIDFIPDIFIRALISGDATHTGLLIAAYIIGASVLGFYGLFLAPILLVLVLCAGQTLVPYILSGEVPDYNQQTFDTYSMPPEDQNPEADTSQSILRHLRLRRVSNALHQFNFW